MEMVVVGTPDGNQRLRWQIAAPESAAVVSSIIRSVGPGTYRDSDSARVHRITQDAIAYERLEAGALLLFHADGRFKSIVLAL
jgi:hypothetical protein